MLETSAQIAEEIRRVWSRQYPNQSQSFIDWFEWEELLIPIGDVISNGSPQNLSKARRYYKKLMEGTVIFPPLICINGLLVDGYHRYWAYGQAGFRFVRISRNRAPNKKCEIEQHDIIQTTAPDGK